MKEESGMNVAENGHCLNPTYSGTRSLLWEKRLNKADHGPSPTEGLASLSQEHMEEGEWLITSLTLLSDFKHVIIRNI